MPSQIWKCIFDIFKVRVFTQLLETFELGNFGKFKRNIMTKDPGQTRIKDPGCRYPYSTSGLHVFLLSLSRLCGQVPLARSETHLSELLDGVCNSMSDYALHVDPDTQHKQYMRFAPRGSGATGDFPDFKNFQFDGPDASNALKFAVSTKVLQTVRCSCNITVISLHNRGLIQGHV